MRLSNKEKKTIKIETPGCGIIRVMGKKAELMRILVAIPTSTHTQRQLLEGLLAYAHAKGGAPWQLHLDLRDLNRQHLKDLARWRCSGVIAYILSARERRSFLATGLPAVFIEPLLAQPPRTARRNVVTFVNEHATEGRTAADYFLTRHYRSFAYVGTARPTFWSDERRRGFAARLREAGHRPAVYGGLLPAEQDDFALESRRLAKWLRELPRPTAVFCVHDRRAQQVIATAQAAGLRVPDDLAVLGVDDDELLCEMTVPAISSIPVGDHARGEAVGAAMDALLSGRPTPRHVVSRHTAVTTRRSTDAQAISDAFVARALAHASRDLSTPRTLDELAVVAGCSKTELAHRARAALGHSLGDELTGLRLDRAIACLAQTTRTVDEIAKSCGFCSASHLGLRLRAAFGKSPSAYRSASDRGLT